MSLSPLIKIILFFSFISWPPFLLCLKCQHNYACVWNLLFVFYSEESVNTSMIFQSAERKSKYDADLNLNSKLRDLQSAFKCWTFPNFYHLLKTLCCHSRDKIFNCTCNITILKYLSRLQVSWATHEEFISHRSILTTGKKMNKLKKINNSSDICQRIEITRQTSAQKIRQADRT